MNLENFDFTEGEILYIKGMEIECLKFQFDRDKLNPFSLERIRLSIYMKMYSKYLARDITSISDACLHAKYHARHLGGIAVATSIDVPINEIGDQTESYVELLGDCRDWYKAKLRLNKAKAQRDIALKQLDLQRTETKAQWDKHVKMLHTEFLAIDNANCKGASDV